MGRRETRRRRRRRRGEGEGRKGGAGTLTDLLFNITLPPRPTVRLQGARLLFFSKKKNRKEKTRCSLWTIPHCRVTVSFVWPTTITWSLMKQLFPQRAASQPVLLHHLQAGGRRASQGGRSMRSNQRAYKKNDSSSGGSFHLDSK